MMRRAALFAALASASCGDLPGDVVGTYQVTMQLRENSCGAGGLPLPDGYSYAVQLRAEGMQGYWRVPKAAPIQGRYDNGAFEFRTTMSLDLGNVDAGTSGCLVRRDEVVQGDVVLESDAGALDAGRSEADAGSSDAPLIGEHRISFTPDPGGRCANENGPINVFERLPCSALYRLVGVSRKSF